MKISDIICSPLGWNESLPFYLRDNFLLSQNINSVDDVCVVDPGSKIMGIDYLVPKFLDEMEKVDWEKMGLTFCDKKEFSSSEYERLLSKIESLLYFSKNMHSSIKAFAINFHPLLSECEDFDVSFSDPCIPFDVFTNVPKYEEKYAAERFVEGIIHETLHLQLTAMEHLLPLFHDTLLTDNVFSPWKGEGRNERGLLHAVYVFSNIKNFWLKVHAQSNHINDFAVKRINEIQKELSTAGHILKSDALTPEGRMLACLCLL